MACEVNSQGASDIQGANGDDEGDAKGALLSYISMTYPVLGAVITAVQFIAAEFKDKAFDAEGHYLWDPNANNGQGAILANVDKAEGDGARPILVGMMTQLLQGATEALADYNRQNGTHLQLDPANLPALTVRGSQGEPRIWMLRWKNPITGRESARTFDADGNYLSPGFSNGDPGPQAPQDTRYDYAVDPLDQAILSAFGGQIAAGGNDAFNDNFFKTLMTQFIDLSMGWYEAGEGVDNNALSLAWWEETKRQQRGDYSRAQSTDSSPTKTIARSAMNTWAEGSKGIRTCRTKARRLATRRAGACDSNQQRLNRELEVQK